MDINECGSNPCKNEGQCVNELNGYKCKCKTGFNGTNCEINIDDCANPNPCQNGATCSDGLASYTCSCASGFTGKQCETNIDDCKSLPCQHYGTCVDGVNSYSCVCAPGYTGKNCDIDFDECSSNPCMFGGTCENKQNGFQCKCPQGTSGKLPENLPLWVLFFRGGQCYMQIFPYNISMSKNIKCNYLMRWSLKTVWTVADVTFSLCHE